MSDEYRGDIEDTAEGGDSYGILAYVYDRLNSDIDYKKWADFIEACFLRYGEERPALVLDLGCGTGKMTHELAVRGYDMIGVDLSADMLAVAAERRTDPQNPLFLHQDMQDFELYGSVGAVVSCLDSINYLTDEGGLLRCFSCVENYLDPGGLFIFDVNTPYKFEHIFTSNAYILEAHGNDKCAGEVFCAWQNFYDPEEHICDFRLTLFEQGADGTYLRAEEWQAERCFTLEQICSTLKGAGLEFFGVFGDFDFGAPGEECERWFIIARKPAVS